MPNSPSASVDAFLADLDHPRKPEIQELRAAVLKSNPGVTEHVKWNAPSFCINGEDRITFRLQPGNRVELVFHRGAKKRSDADSFRFSDPSGLIQWSTPDRGTVSFRDHDDLRSKLPVLAELAQGWFRATAD